jgi:hypothetical protein
MKLSSVVRCVCAGAVAAIAFGSFAVAATPTPGPVCRVAAAYLIPVNASEPGTGLYAVGMFAYDTPAPVVSGTVSFFGEGKRYDVPFRDFQTSSVGSPPKSYLAVRFPTPVHVDVAYISALTTPVSAACPPELLTATNTAAPSHSIDVAMTIDAPPSVEDGGSCDRPFAAVRVVKALPPDIPDDIRLRAPEGRDDVWVLVHISHAGAVVGTTVIKHAKFVSFDNEVAKVARQSTYAPAIFRCAAVDNYYAFVGVYEFTQRGSM